jgi:hypothetical protein
MTSNACEIVLARECNDVPDDVPALQVVDFDDVI